MLTPSEIDSLRDAVQAAQRRPFRGPWTWATFADGPLAGLRARIDRGTADRAGAQFGWCHLTPRGPVVACYQHGAAPGEWVFRRYDAPGARASGREAA